MHPRIISALAILISLIPLESLASPTQAARAKISAFSPSSAAAQGGSVIRVKGTNLQNIKKVRVAGTIQGILTSESKSGFSFVLPKLPWVTRKYGGFVEIEIFEAGAWKTMKTRFLATAQRQKQFTSGRLTYRILDYDQENFVKVNKFTFPPPFQNETIESVWAEEGYSYFVVKSLVLNNSDSAVDLGCGNLIQIVLLNRKLQSFKPDRLDELTFRGNPECNDLKKPGSETTVGWAFHMNDNFIPYVIRVNSVDKNGIAGRTVYLNFWG